MQIELLILLMLIFGFETHVILLHYSYDDRRCCCHVMTDSCQQTDGCERHSTEPPDTCIINTHNTTHHGKKAYFVFSHARRLDYLFAANVIYFALTSADKKKIYALEISFFFLLSRRWLLVVLGWLVLFYSVAHRTRIILLLLLFGDCFSHWETFRWKHAMQVILGISRDTFARARVNSTSFGACCHHKRDRNATVFTHVQVTPFVTYQTPPTTEKSLFRKALWMTEEFFQMHNTFSQHQIHDGLLAAFRRSKNGP